MNSRIIKGSLCKRLDHYLTLNVNNDEIINLIPDNIKSKIIASYDEVLEFCIPTRDLKYYDKNGNYWDNYIE